MADPLKWLYSDPEALDELAQYGAAPKPKPGAGKFDVYAALLDFARGAGMGATTDVLGYPVDTMTTALRPLGYDVEKPVGGSDWLAERFTSPTGSKAEMAGRVVGGMLTPGPEDLMRMAGMLPQKVPLQELTTYHGSPHRINNVDEANPLGKFDLSKVGTGEGAQAYGHGIYLAENPGVAKSYRGLQAPVGQGPRQQALVHEAMKQSSNDRAAARSLLNDWAKRAESNDSRQRFYDAANNLDAILDTPPGHLYTVDLPDEHIAKMLDWDAPLSEQPEILAKLRKAGYALADDDSLTGGQFHKKLLQELGANQDEVSADLLANGIPGIRYMDGNSRGYVVNLTYKGKPYETVGKDLRFPTLEQAQEYAQEQIEKGFGAKVGTEGTRNFVIFDPDIAKILKRE